MKYRAFFSYSRADDKLANWLHGALDRYRTPKALIGVRGRFGPVPTTLHPIFRDRSDLSSGGHIAEDLQVALEQSERLIILCTPHSAKSRWVDHEVQTFLALGREEHIFPVIGAGEPDSGDDDIECFPPSLRGKGILGADLREIRLTSGQLVGDGREGGRLKLIAGLLGVPLDALIRRERARQRTLRLALSATAAVFALLAVAATALGVVAMQNAAIAERRAAIMAVDTARADVSEGRTDAALLILLHAAQTLDEDGHPPDTLLIAFDEALRRAHAERTLDIPAGAQFFDAPIGAYITDPRLSQISLLGADGEIRPVATAGGNPVFVGSTATGSLIVVREDLAIERIDEGQRPRLIGQFAPQALSRDTWTGDPAISYFPGGALVLQSETDPRVQVFDLLTQANQQFEVRAGRILFARLGDGRRIVFDGGHFAADLDRIPPGEAPALSWGPDIPAFEDIAFHACEGRVPVQRPPFRGGGPTHLGVTRDSCRAGRSSIVWTSVNFMSAGIERTDLIFDMHGNAETISAWTGDPDLDSQTAGDNLDWVALSPNSDRLAASRGRVLYVRHTTASGSPLTLRFPAPITYARFLGNDAVALVTSDRDYVSVVNVATPFEYAQSAAPEHHRPTDLLYPLVCHDSSSSSVGSASMSRRADDHYLLRIEREGLDAETIASFGACARFSPSRRYVAIRTASTHISLYDLAIAGAPEIGTFPVPLWGDLNFVGDTGSVVVAPGDNSVRRYERRNDDDGDGANWVGEFVYRGDHRVDTVQSDIAGQRLLIREQRGFGDVRGFLYSIEAQREWRTVGVDYKWLTFAFTQSGDVLTGRSDEWRSLMRIHDLSQAVLRANAYLSPRCRPISPARPRTSPCWPDELH